MVKDKMLNGFMTKQEIIDKINNDIAEEYEVPINAITPDAEIWQTLQLDSMRALQIIIIVKRLFGILIPPRHLPRLTTFQTLYDYIWEKIKI